jgi:hypothetical protein
LLDKGSLDPHVTSPAEVSDLRAVVERDLKDAGLTELSADRRFATAYNAVLQLCKMAIHCSGYRVKGRAAHAVTFDAVEIALGASVSGQCAYFDSCRRKRNAIDYDSASIASNTEADELLREATAFRDTIDAWIENNYPALASDPDPDS